MWSHEGRRSTDKKPSPASHGRAQEHGLLGNFGAHAQSVFGGGPKHEAHPKHEHEEQKVTQVELFSDLAFVVAIHVVAIPLEEEADPFGKHLLVYALRVFLLWMLWYGGTIFTNVANLFTPGADALQGRHYCIIFLLMGCSTLLAQSCSRGNDQAAIGFYLAAEVINLIASVYQNSTKTLEQINYERLDAHENPMDKVQYGKILSLCKRRGYALIVIGGGLVLTMYTCDAETGAASDYALAIWGVSSAALIVARFAVSCFKHKDKSAATGARKVHALDVESFNERHELIMLIFTGELIFAAAAPGSYAISVMCLTAAICIFLLHFVAKPAGREESWRLSSTGGMINAHLHYVMFAAIPGIGAGYARAIHAAGHAAGHAAHGEGLEHGEGRALGVLGGEECVASNLLIYSSSVFMLASAAINATTKDPQHNETRLRASLEARSAVRCVLGLGIAALSQTKCETGVAAAAEKIMGVPALMAVSAAFELWCAPPPAMLHPSRPPYFEVPHASLAGRRASRRAASRHPPPRPMPPPRLDAPLACSEARWKRSARPIRHTPGLYKSIMEGLHVCSAAVSPLTHRCDARYHKGNREARTPPHPPTLARSARPRRDFRTHARDASPSLRCVPVQYYSIIRMRTGITCGYLYNSYVYRRYVWLSPVVHNKMGRRLARIVY